MAIPTHIVERLDRLLGVSGRPRAILYNGEWIDTGCMEWTTTYSQRDAFLQMDPLQMDTIRRWGEHSTQCWSQVSRSLLAALQRWQGYLLQTIPNARQPELQEPSPEYDRLVEARTREFFAQEPPPIRAEFEAFMASLGETEFLYQACYRHGITFFDAVGQVQTRQFLAKEPPQVQAAFATYMANMMRASVLYQFTHPPKKAFKAATLAQVRSALQGEPLLAYEAGLDARGIPHTIVVAPTTDPFDILRCERTDAANYGLDTEDVIARLKTLDEKYGIDITGAGGDGVAFTLKRVPKGEEARELGRWLLDFCPDLHEAPVRFPKGKVSLWWD